MNNRICIVSVTYYTNPTDIRFTLAQQLCKCATQKQINLIIVDDSPPEIQQQLWQEQGPYVQMFQQNKELYQGKGGALRQAIDCASSWFLGGKMDLKQCAICFTEPEKVDLINHISDIVQPLLLDGNDAADLVVPFRNRKLFQQSYPIEQFHSESFANLHFNLLAKRHQGFQHLDKGLDWLFGPFAFNASLAKHWLEYTGKSWDAQMIPYVRGIRNDGWKVCSVEVDFLHPVEMKEQEEGDPVWSEKRLSQLNILFELLGKVELT